MADQPSGGDEDMEETDERMEETGGEADVVNSMDADAIEAETDEGSGDDELVEETTVDTTKAVMDQPNGGDGGMGMPEVMPDQQWDSGDMEENGGVTDLTIQIWIDALLYCNFKQPNNAANNTVQLSILQKMKVLIK